MLQHKQMYQNFVQQD